MLVNFSLASVSRTKKTHCRDMPNCNDGYRNTLPGKSIARSRVLPSFRPWSFIELFLRTTQYKIFSCIRSIYMYIMSTFLYTALMVTIGENYVHMLLLHLRISYCLLQT